MMLSRSILWQIGQDVALEKSCGISHSMLLCSRLRRIWGVHIARLVTTCSSSALGTLDSRIGY
jgi:hypothetical protein